MDALVAVGGIDKTFDVLTARADGLSFEDAFKKVYGISWDEASVVLSKTVSKIYKENKKQSYLLRTDSVDLWRR